MTKAKLKEAHALFKAQGGNLRGDDLLAAGISWEDLVRAADESKLSAKFAAALPWIVPSDVILAYRMVELTKAMGRIAVAVEARLT